MSKKQIEIGAFMGPRRPGHQYWNREYGKHPDDPTEGYRSFITEKDFQDYMDCGFTFAYLEEDGWYDYDYINRKQVDKFEDSGLYTYMELAEKMNLPVVCSSKWLIELVISGKEELSDEDKAIMKKMVEDLSKYKMFKGMTYLDEPHGYLVKTVEAVENYLKSIKPDIFMYVAMLPIYGATSMYSNNITDDKVVAYKEYVQKMGTATGKFVFDHYPLYVDAKSPTEQVTSLQSDYYQNLDIVAQTAKEHGFETGLIVQSTSWGPYGKEYSSMHPRRIETKADVAFQVYSAIAYGMKSIGYYTYWPHYSQGDRGYVYSAIVGYPRNEDGSPNPNGETVKTPAYYAVQEVNREIQKFADVIWNFNWEGTMTATGAGKEKSDLLAMIPEYISPRVLKLSSEDEIILGCQKDEDGNDGFVLVNVTDPGKNIANRATIKFAEADSARCYICGNERMVQLEEGEYTFELEPGQGIFIIPIKNP